MFPASPRRSAVECRAHWWALTRSKGFADKRAWSTDEDELLSDLVEEYAHHNWSIIASQIPGRNAKQCRERWHNQIRPDLKHSPWSQEEDAEIIARQREIGNKWAMIARHLPGRTDNMVKNRWHATLARRGKLSTSSAPRSPSSVSSLLPETPPTTLSVVSRQGHKRAWDDEHGRHETEILKKRKNSISSRDTLDAMVNCVAQILLTWQQREATR